MTRLIPLIEDFNDDTIEPNRWIPYGGVERQTNQRLEIPLQSGVANSFGGLSTATGYDLTGAAVHMELVQAPRAANPVEVYLTIARDSQNAASLLVSDGLLYCSQRVAGIIYDVATQPYDAARHRWLQLREQAGTLHYETSADGCTWITQAAVPVPFDVTVVRVDIAAVSIDPVASPGMAIIDNVNTGERGLQRRVEERRQAARAVRDRAGALAAARPHHAHASNNDEAAYPATPFAGNYSKSLQHDALGDPLPASYATLLRALQTENPGDFEAIALAAGAPVRLTNPQAGLAFDIAGPDAQALTMPPAPRFDSVETAHEMGELYWMAVARDVAFINYPTDALIGAAVASIQGEFPQYGGPVPVTRQNVFRGIYPGEQVGPYVSQFLLKGNIDPRKPNGLGLDAAEGFVAYGARVIDQRIIPAAAGVDYLTGFASWRDVQNGVDRRGQDQFDTTRRFIRNLRDGATLVHFDNVIDAYYNAAHLLLSEPAGNQLVFQSGLTGRPQIDLEFTKNPGHPYDPPGGYSGDSRTQTAFATFGPVHLLQALSEVLGRALRAVWWQKWGVHRRLRPEEYGGRVHNQILHTATSGIAGRSYPLHPSITTSIQSGGLAPYFGGGGEPFPTSYLLPQAYPEGAPTHPAYGAGHAAGSGACITILKAFFDESAPIQSPVQARADGVTLVSYTGADAVQMSVGSELNKLAGNIALFRNAAGVHWRSDYTQSLVFGEAVAIGLLQEMSLGFNEDHAYFQLTRLDGQTIRIFDGKVEPAVV